jgi:hypothetical protein
MIRHTAAEHAPWFVVPANKKWYARLVVSMVVVDALKQLKLAYPKVSPEARQELEKAKADLLHPGKRKDDHCEKRVPRPA